MKPPKPMLFDDRLATVLRSPAGGEAAVRTQYRQLVDLLGGRAEAGRSPDFARYRQFSDQVADLPPAEFDRLLARPALTLSHPVLLAFLGWQRLESLAQRIPEDERSRILREPGVRLRNPQLVALLAEGDPRPAAAALATAQLEESEWLDLIPRLSMMARGFLRHRRDLPPAVRDLLASLGVRDMVLPQPAQVNAVPSTAEESDDQGIRALLRRIEAFRAGRKASSSEARLPLGDGGEDDSGKLADTIDFVTGPDLRIAWAEADLAPLLIGMRIGPPGPGVIAALDDHGSEAAALRQPIGSATLTIDAAPAVSGQWRIDAEPVFAPLTRHFTGFRGRIRRRLPDAASAVAPADTAQDRMRQALHELRTPVNAIQGFAEIIQQQVFGPAPNAYRALAAAIAVDAARLLAAFEELDRLARLEAGALSLAEGTGDLREAVADTVRRLDGVLRPRNAAMTLTVAGSPFTTGIADEDLSLLCWRLLATLAGALAAGETIAANLASDGRHTVLVCHLPQGMAGEDDPFLVARQDRSPAVTAGMFGSGHALRLARAEASAAGGTLAIADGKLALTLPLLTSEGGGHSVAGEGDRATGS